MIAKSIEDLVGREISSTDFLLLKDVVIAEGVENIYECAFAYHNLSSILIPRTVKYIAENAFYGCDNLKSVIIPSSVISIGPHAFAFCKNMNKITIQEGLRTI